MRMERTVLVQVCSSGFVAFVSFQHITPDRLSQYLCCRGKGLGELIARSSQSPAQTTRYTSRSHTHPAALHVMRAMPSTASGPCSLCTSMARALNAWRRGAPSCPASCCGASAWAADTDKHGRTDTFNAREPCQRCPPETLANWTQPSAMQQRYKCLPARAVPSPAARTRARQGGGGLAGGNRGTHLLQEPGNGHGIDTRKACTAEPALLLSESIG